MEIPNNINNYMDILSEITEYGEFHYSGSISDYFNLAGIDFNYEIHDIDITIMDISTLRKIESHFNVQSYLFQSISEYDHHQMILDDDLILDVFIGMVYDNCEGTYNGKRILHETPIGRYNILLDLVTKFEKQNIKDGQHHQRIFKHLKKIMIYKSILNL